MLDSTIAAAPVIDPPTTVFAHVSGQAGTGKTFLARQWSEDASDAVLCSTTGISAINIGGTTVNALLGYFDTHSLRDIYLSGRLHAQLRKLRDSGLRWILLDEVSMMARDQLTDLTRAISQVNNTVQNEDQLMRLTVIGDFGQLQPVNEGFAFESPEWPRYMKNLIKLTEIKRQADADFILALQAVRRGDADRALEFFGSRLSMNADMQHPGVMIFGTNEQVQRHNEILMDGLPGTLMQFTKQEQGQLRGEWKQIPFNLFLKAGALVMILANKRQLGTTSFDYVNGDLGELLDMQGANALVRLQRTGQEMLVSPVTRRNTKPMTAERRAELRKQYAEHPQDAPVTSDWKYEVVGSVTYMPLRAAWASTVHKSQGLSFDHAQVDIRNHFFTQPAMLYVALSRARTAEGLRVIGNAKQFAKRCVVDERVKPWL